MASMRDHIGETVRVRVGEPGAYRWFEGPLISVSDDGEQAAVGETTVAAVDVLLIDVEGCNYRLTEIGPWRMSFCCGASAKGAEGGIVCRACYGDVDFPDGPARLTDDDPVVAPTAYIYTLPKEGK